MKSILLSLPDGQAEVFTKRLVELMKECGVSAQVTTPEKEQYEPEKGDFVAFADDSTTEPYIGIFKKWYGNLNEKIVCYAHITNEGELQDEEAYWNADNILRPASDEEKERLISALARNKERWNPETKEFEECGTYEAIRSFEDACADLNKRAEAGDKLANVLMTDLQFNSPRTPDLEAYIKLRIVAYAINEGWEPKFVEGEYRWFPWFRLYTQDEIDAMSEEQRAKVLSVGGPANLGAPCGLSCAVSNAAFSNSNTHIGARLAFSDKARAEYAGKRFIELYAALNFRAVERKAE